MARSGRLATYYALTKPGIIRGNLLTAAAGFLLGAAGQVEAGRLGAMLVGTALIIASACVFNNYLDRGIDAKMDRTKRRALVIGAVSGRAAMIYATSLGLVGAAVLAAWTNWLTLGLGLLGLFAYVVLYGWGKRHTVHGTLIGTISGAVPPVAGYAAATGRLDAGALILFVILVCWQMPHFYAVAMYRLKDYQAAGLPVLPVKRGAAATKIQMLSYTAAFVVAATLLTTFGYVGYTYLVVILVVGLWWFWSSLDGLQATDDARWARGMFGRSLLVLLVWSVAAAWGPLLP